MQNVTDAFVKFAQETTYDSIPPEVIRESKRILLDGLGNALGGIASDKGKIGIMQAKLMGGVPEATVIGVGGKYSAAVSAFANAELWNGHCYPEFGITKIMPRKQLFRSNCIKPL